MRWPQDAKDWPLTDHSRHLRHGPHHWHIQEAGSGDTLMLVHGAGGATQSWRGLFPLLAQTHHVVAMDLPGQGFTRLGARARCGLDAMAEDIHALQRHEGWQPRALIGHSAGAAIALRMAERGALPPGAPIIGINAALGNFRGVAGWLFPMLAKVLSLNPLTASIFTATATPRTVENLIRGTGSQLPPEGLALYHRLSTDRTHVDATLAMMAQWQLDGLLNRLSGINHPVSLIVGDKDLAVPPDTSTKAARKLPDAQVITLPGLGHLAHEEAPETVLPHIITALG